MVTEGRLDEITTVVFDEFHGVGSERGPSIEIAIAKLLVHSRRRHDERRNSVGGRRDSLASTVSGSGGTSSSVDGASVQIIGMSATLPNVEHMALWLTPCEVHVENARPVPLIENIIDREGMVRRKGCELALLSHAALAD